MKQASEGNIGRRAVLGGIGAATLVGCVDNTSAGEEDAASAAAPRFVDLTHRLTSDYSFGSPPRISHEAIAGSGVDYGMLLNRFSLVEHTGTHIDVPMHFGADRADLSEIPLDDLIAPLAVFDAREQAAATSNFSLMPEHIMEWEAEHGQLPDGGCLAIWSGFDPLDFLARMRESGERPAIGMPGFSPEAIDWLLENRSLKGIAVDAMTLDSGNYTPQYPGHNAWLTGTRWGIEMITNLEAVPAVGATLIVGAAPIAEATGFPVRLIAML